jgi:hypothetical protein
MVALREHVLVTQPQVVTKPAASPGPRRLPQQVQYASAQ